MADENNQRDSLMIDLLGTRLEQLGKDSKVLGGAVLLDHRQEVVQGGLITLRDYLDEVVQALTVLIDHRRDCPHCGPTLKSGSTCEWVAPEPEGPPS